MDQLKTRTAVAAALLAVATAASLGGCVNATPVSPTPTSSVTTTPRSSTTPTPEATLPDAPPDEPLLGALEAQHGSSTLGPYPVTFGRLNIYFRCVGDGVATISIPGAASFPNACDPTGEDNGIKNSIDVRFITSITAEVTVPDGSTWAIKLTSGNE